MAPKAARLGYCIKMRPGCIIPKQRCKLKENVFSDLNNCFIIIIYVKEKQYPLIETHKICFSINDNPPNPTLNS